VFAVPGRVIAAMFILALVVIPMITTDLYILRILTFAGIFAIYASSWDLLSGVAGQLSLGHALFFGVGAYVSALVNIHFGLSPWLTVPIGAIVAVMVGLLVGLPALRLRGFYLGLVTFTFPLILNGILFLFPDVTGGELGLYGLKGLSGSKIFDYWIVNTVMLCSVFVMWKLADAGSKIIKFGLILQAIREDEITARTSGIDTTRYKLVAFALSGFFGGIAGGLYAHFIRSAGPTTLDLFFSIQVILWTVFGGIGTIYGAVVGVYILYILIELLSLSGGLLSEIRMVVSSLILIFTLLFMPEGLSVWVRDKIEITCPRCKLINSVTRRYCRACGAPLHLDEQRSKEQGEG